MGQLVLEEGELKEIDFQLDHFPVDYDKERIARRLAPLNHLQNLKSSIPDSVTFMDLYQAETVEDLHIASRWKEHAPYKSLAVPLGLRGQGDVVSLNLHEKAHGPHGLIAGTKSIYYKTDTIVQVIKEEVPTAFVAMRMYDQALIKHEEISKELQLQNDEMYLYNNEKYTKIKIITNEYRR